MNETKIQLADSIANPAPLGLLGFGMTTVLLNLANAGIMPLTSVVVSIGIFYGGISQVIAGIMEFRKGNTFGATAFTSYGFFWLSLIGILWLPKAGFAAPTGPAMASFLFLWGLFSLVMFICTRKHPRSSQWVFGTLVVLFFLLAAGDLSGNKGITMVAGYEGIVCGLLAIYAACGQLLHDAFGKKVIPY
ncbi:MAG: acetate uptake transporter [Bacillota bacterium]